MADDATESEIKLSKINVPSNLLDTFWTLAEGSEEVRIKCSADVVDILKELQGSSKKPCKQLLYALKRLVKGVSSNRKWARVGFSLALTQVLRSFPELSAKFVLDTATTELQTTRNDAKSEKSNAMLGKIMVYLSLIQSGRIYEADESVLGEICEALMKFRQQKKPLHLLCTQSLCHIIMQVSEDTFTKALWPHLKTALSSGWKDCDPDILLLLLAAKKHKNIVGKKFLASHWGNKNIISESTAPSITEVMMASTLDHPILHGVCTALTEQAAKKPERLKLFWNDVVLGKMLEGNLNQKYVCLRLVPFALQHASSVDQVEAILDKRLMKFIFRNATNKNDTLHATTIQLLTELTKCVTNYEDGDMQFVVMMSLLNPPCIYMFDIVSHTKTVSNILHHLQKDALLKVIDIMKSLQLGENALQGNTEENVEARRKWATFMLTSCLSNKNIITDPDTLLSVLQFLFLHSFFDLQSPDPTLPHADKLPKAPVTQPVRQSLQDGFFKSVRKLSTLRTAEKTKSNTHIETLYKLVKHAKVVLKSKHVKYIKNQNITELLKGVLKHVDDIREKESAGKGSESAAFQLLFLQLGLQLFTDPTQAEETLQDLSVCCEKAFSKKRRMSMKKNDTEPDWVEVVVEVLLSLLSQQSNLNRVMASTVFSMLAPHLTPAALDLVIQVMKTGGEEEGQIGFEDDDEDDEEEAMDTESTADDGEDGDDEEEDDEEDEDEEDTSSDEESNEEDVEQLRKSLKQALGKAAISSDDEEEQDEEEMDDEAMFRLDGAISDAFKSMKKSSKKEEKQKAIQIRSFKMRCLDLVESLINEHTAPSMLLRLCQPLLELLDQASRDKTMRQVEERLRSVFNKLTKLRQFAPDPELDLNSLPAMFSDLLTYSTKVAGIPMVLNVASACLFLMRTIVHFQGKDAVSPVKTRSKRAEGTSATKTTPLEEVMEIVQKALSDFCQKRDSQLSHMLFHSMCERQPVLMWPLAQMLLDLVVSDDVRVFCKTQVASMLSVMMQKNTFKQLEETLWTEFSMALVKTVIQHVEGEKMEQMKPRYLYELLLLLHRTVTASQGQVLELIPEGFAGQLQEVKSKHNSKDLRTVCNQLLARINRQRGTANPNKQKEKEERRRKRKLAEMPNGNKQAKAPPAAKKTKHSTKQTPQPKTGKKAKKPVNGKH